MARTPKPKPKKAQESADADSTIWALCACLAEWVDLIDPDRIPPDLAWQWIEKKDAGFGYQFVFWQHLLRAQYLIGKLPSPVPCCPALTRLAVMRVRGILSDFADRSGLAELAGSELGRVGPVWDGGGVPDWSNAPLPSSLLLLNEAEHVGLILALQDLLNAYGERFSAQRKTQGATAPAETPQPGESPNSGGLDVPGKLIGAAYQLKREGKAVSVAAAARRAGVDRTNLYHRHPKLVDTIKQMGRPDRDIKRGRKNSKTGQIEAVDEDDDDDEE